MAKINEYNVQLCLMVWRGDGVRTECQLDHIDAQFCMGLYQVVEEEGPYGPYFIPSQKWDVAQSIDYERRKLIFEEPPPDGFIFCMVHYYRKD